MKRQTTAYTATLKLVRGGLIAALYVAMTYVSFFLGLSSGVIQFRLSEALCVLPIFLPEAVPALAVGCLLANFLTGCAVWDVIFGAVATLIGAVGAYLLRGVGHYWLATLPTILANAIIVPFVLIYAYGAEGGYFFFMLTVAIGEIACAGVLGTVLAYGVSKTKMFSKGK